MSTPSIVRILALVAGGAVVAACGDDHVEIARGRFEAGPALVLFGQVGIGTAATQLVELRNTGRASLTAAKVEIETAVDADVFAVRDFLIADCSDTPRTEPRTMLGPGQCARFHVQYAPKTIGLQKATVKIIADSPDAASVSVELVGEGVGSSARVCVPGADGEVPEGACTAPGTTPTLDFGGVLRGTTVKRSVKIANDGVAPLTLDAVEVVTDEGIFALASTPRTAPMERGDTTSIDISFSPVAKSPYEGMLRLRTNDPARPTIEIPLTGRGTEPMVRVCLLDALGAINEAECSRLADTPPTLPIIGFLATPLTERTTRTLRILNDGDAPLRVTGITLESGAPEFDVHSEITSDIAPASHADLELGFVPRVEGGRAGRVIVRTSDFVNGELPLELEGRGIAPSLKLCVLNEAGLPIDGLCTALTASPPLVPAIDFGRVAWFTTETARLRITNEGIAPLRFMSAALENAAPDFALTASGLPMTLAPGASHEIDISFAPVSRGALTAELVVVSNDPRKPELRIAVRGDAAGPELCVVPSAGIDFGRVNMPNNRSLGAIVRNCGLVPYTLNGVVLAATAPATNEFVITGVPSMPTTLAPGADVQLQIVYTPRAERIDRATLTVTSQYETKSIPVQGEGAPATCASAPPIARPGGPYTIRPLGTATLSGTTSTSPRPGALTYAWRIAARPTNSTAQLQNPTTAQPKLYGDLAGEFTVELVVTDSAGCQSQPANAIVRVVPDKKIHVQLTWPQDYGDVDLHYLRPGGSFFSSNDVYFSNKTPNWFTTTQGGNPTLDIDDVWGNGPENVNHDRPPAGTYRVWVHYYCARECVFGFCSGSRRNSSPTLKVFIDGVKQFERTVTLSYGQLWEAANIVVAGSGTSSTVTVGASTTPTIRNESGNGCELF